MQSKTCEEQENRSENRTPLQQHSAPHSPGLSLREHIRVDVDHQVAAWQVLHDEADVVAGLEAAMEVDQEGMSGGVDHLEDPLLAHQAA